ncbi:hypothetical protein [Bradyrhizobium sp. sGM-13]|nr:hypothetical protein [Bradyrhizobium sp. sGM-13]
MTSASGMVADIGQPDMGHAAADDRAPMRRTAVFARMTTFP